VKEDDYLLNLTRYIHLNPITDKNKTATYKGQTFVKLTDFDFSSYQDYLGLRKTEWLSPEFILEYFNENKKQGIINKNSYKDFVENYQFDPSEILGNPILE
ncbi:hypothetical protein COY62_03410, partial [bacterium (Candidatus Howlettbacteria) CG_4_10_14_0_8_um_filter_40_9]